MQTTLSDAPAQAEPVDGRQSLRLVKIRLALTLIAVAILPVAALAPFVRMIVDDPRLAQQERLTAQADHAAAELRRELRGIEFALNGVVAQPAITGMLGARPSAATAKAASATLAGILARPSGVVAGVAVVDSTGAARAAAGGAATAYPAAPPPPAGQAAFRVTPGVGGDPTGVDVVVAVPAPGGARAGTLVASVPLPQLLLWSNADVGTASQTIAIVDGAGTVQATLSTSSSTSADGTGQAPVIQVTDDSSTIRSGSAGVLLPGLEDWQVVAAAPLTVVSLPLPALALLVVLLLLLIGATWWMGRQILAPAAALDAQRTEFQSLYHTAREAALRDSLTGLGNHRAFQEAVGQMVEQTRRYGRSFGLILFDIDEFKRVNDTRGHAVGDELLREVGEIVRSSIRSVDSGFRIGGDEFAVILAETDAPGAEIVARRILRRALEERRGEGYSAPISLSIGVTACPQFGHTRMELTAQADAALYRGKRGGRTCVTVFDPDEDRGHVDAGMRAELSAAVAAVIESGSLTPVYQPIVHLPTGRILGYEGLVRVAPTSGFPHTGAMFDAAEVAGRVLDLDRAALEVVLRGASALPPETLISLNVSPRSFEFPEFNASTFLGILRRHGMPPDRVLLELTERDAIRDPERLRLTVQTLQSAGVRVAADDVGAGNAGLRLLSQLRFDVVKIDLSLVQGGAGQDQTMTVLTSLIGLARRWGALTIAEGVETAQQLQMIRQLEVDAGQGYLLGRPGPSLSVPDMDLDALAGAPRPDGASAPTDADGRGPAPRPFPGGLGFGPQPVAVGAFGGTPASVPTAASVIATRNAGAFTAR